MCIQRHCSLIRSIVIPAAILLLSLTASAWPPVQVMINEVFYDSIGSDTGCFIELLGPPGLNLDDYSLIGINGEDGKSYSTIDLSGHTIPPDGYFVIAQDDSVPNTDLINVNANFQNGPDSIELWDIEREIDSVGYGDFSLAVFAGEVKPTLDLTGYSIGRRPDGKDTNDNSIDFIGLALPSPGEPNDPRIAVHSKQRLISAWGRIKSASYSQL